MSRYNSSRASYSRGRVSHRSRTPSRGPKKTYINPAKFIRPARAVTVAEVAVEHQFSDFNLHPILQNNLEQLGFTQPSPIQDQAIPAGLAGSDVVGIANTGTGKTAAFALPLLQRLLTDVSSRALIVAPTRELALQIEEQCRALARNSGLSGVMLIGGVPLGPQLRQLQTRPRVIIGTPGRIKDHVERGSLDLSECNVVVLDEVDRMLDMGFVNDITFLLNRTSAQRQNFYFSATLDERVKSIINGFSQQPVYISVKSGDTTDLVDQNIVAFTSTSDKIEKLHDVLIHESMAKAIVFDDTKHSVERLSKELEARGFAASSLHGGKTQSQRQRVLKSFRDSSVTVLVATDVAARGIDVSDITHVINYSTPQTYADYVHRIGRTGRAGKTGCALTFIEA